MRRNLQDTARAALVATACAAAITVAAPALANNVVITYSPPGVYTPNFGTDPVTGICRGASVCDYGMENFSAWTGSSSYTSSFNDAGAGTYNLPAGVSFTGKYAAGEGTTSGEFVLQSQNQYGGVNGAKYPELFGPSAVGGKNSVSTYTLSISAKGVPGANYFGMWISALDAYNDLKIYDGATLIAEFNSPVLQAALGNCSNPAANLYCGNPTTQFKGQDSGELFAYVNVFDLSGSITSVVFSNSGSSGFESTNHALAYINPIHSTGTQIGVPEPLSAAPLLAGLGGLGLALRRRARRASPTAAGVGP